jgi:hypothetical protein
MNETLVTMIGTYVYFCVAFILILVLEHDIYGDINAANKV